MTMKYSSALLCIVSVCIIFFIVNESAGGQKHRRLRAIKADVSEKKIPRSAVPEAVLDSFKTHYPTAIIKGQLKETREKIVYFEIESTDSMKERDVLFEKDGSIVEVEESMDIKDLPSALHDSVLAKYPNAVIKSVESVKRDKHVEYELTIAIGKKKIEAVVNSAGKVFETK